MATTNHQHCTWKVNDYNNSNSSPKLNQLKTDLRWSGNFEAELGRGRPDFGVDEPFLDGVDGSSDGSWSSVEKEARDVV